jgi:hypothetical protein
MNELTLYTNGIIRDSNGNIVAFYDKDMSRVEVTGCDRFFVVDNEDEAFSVVRDIILLKNKSENS